MSVPSRVIPPLLALLAACAFIAFTNHLAIDRLSALMSAADEVPPLAASSPTGYEGGVRQVIVAQHDNVSYQWLAQTQQGIAERRWRVRHVAYDNAPFGRVVLSPSPYRWWIELLARMDHFVSGRPVTVSVEHVAAYADPLLHGLLLIGCAWLIACWFGPAAAVAVTLGAAFSFPFAAEFLGGAPKDHGLTLLAAAGSLLSLAVGVRAQSAATTTATVPAVGREDLRPARRWYTLAGALGGATLWIHPTLALAMVAGVGVGAVLLAVALRGRSNDTIRDQAQLWLGWGIGGAVTILAASLLEFAPEHLTGWHLEQVHPVWGVGWLAAAVLFAGLTRTIAAGRSGWNARRSWRLLPPLISLVGVGIVAVKSGAATTLATSFALESLALPGAHATDPLWTWLGRGSTPAGIVAVLLPVLLTMGAAVILRRHRDRLDSTVLFTIGPVAVLLVLAGWHAYWWGAFQVAVLVFFAAAIGAVARTVGRQWLWVGAVAVACVPGAIAAVKLAGVSNPAGFSEPEVIALVERDLAHWLARRAGPQGAVVLAPPSLATSLYFHGGLHVLGTPYWENNEGMNAAVRLAGASSPDEGLALAQKRGVNYIALPSWDTALDEFVRAGSNEPDKALLALLHQMHPPRWLRPVPYPMPEIPGFEGRSVAVFEVVEVQDNVVALSRLAEYFVEMQQLQQAAGVAITLERSFPNDIDGFIARAAVANAYGDAERSAAALKVLTGHEAPAAVASLPWDRRVSYAIALAQGQRLDLARTQVQQCLTDVSETHLRFLTPQSLYRFLLLCKVCRLEIPDPALSRLARQMLPPEMRDKV